VHILPENECGVITIEVDLEQNPELPLLTVHGDVGIHMACCAVQHMCCVDT
jgi:hypothetical protein